MTAKDIAVIITAIGVPCLMFLAGAVYHICEYIKSKRPHKSDDEEDNPIVKFKDDLAEIYESNPNGKLKKLAQAVWNRVEEIEKWHDTEIKDIERRYYSVQCDAEELKDRCNKYNKELGEWYARYDNLKKKFAESEKCLNHSLEREANLRKANEGLHKLLKEEQEKNKIPIFSGQTKVPAYLINDNAFDSQINPFSKITIDEEALKQSIPMNTGAIIHIDSEDLNRYSVGRGPDGELLKDEPKINDSEFVEKLRDIWAGLDNDTEYHQYSVTVRKYGDCNEKKIVVLARSPIEAAKLVPKGYTVENISRLFE